MIKNDPFEIISGIAEDQCMKVVTVNFPEIKVAVVDHHGLPECEHESVKIGFLAHHEQAAAV